MYMFLPLLMLVVCMTTTVVYCEETQFISYVDDSHSLDHWMDPLILSATNALAELMDMTSTVSRYQEKQMPWETSVYLNDSHSQGPRVDQLIPHAMYQLGSGDIPGSLRSSSLNRDLTRTTSYCEDLKEKRTQNTSLSNNVIEIPSVWDDLMCSRSVIVTGFLTTGSCISSALAAVAMKLLWLLLISIGMVLTSQLLQCLKEPFLLNRSITDRLREINKTLSKLVTVAKLCIEIQSSEIDRMQALVNSLTTEKRQLERKIECLLNEQSYSCSAIRLMEQERDEALKKSLAYQDEVKRLDTYVEKLLLSVMSHQPELLHH